MAEITGDQLTAAQIPRDLLQALSEAVGVAGNESEVRGLIHERIVPHISDLSIDAMGNLIARRAGTGESALRVLISAPMDEIGFMVSEVDGDGLIHLMPIGALDFRYIPARRVLVGANKLPGVLTWTPIHKRHGKSVVEPDDMVIDVGARGSSIAGVAPGDRIAFQGDYALLNGTIARGKAFDSRVGCAALIALLTDDSLHAAPLPFDLHVAFTAQSKIGGRGAGVAAHRIDPQVAITLGGMAATDTPAHPDAPQLPLIKLGGGPVLGAIEGRIPLAHRLRDSISRIAADLPIPLQIDAQLAPIGQAYSFSRARAAIPTAAIGVPIRYLGSPNALIDLTDADRLLALLRAVLPQLTPDLFMA